MTCFGLQCYPLSNENSEEDAVSFSAEFQGAVTALEAYARGAVAREGRAIRQPALSGLVEALGVEKLIADGGLHGR